MVGVVSHTIMNSRNLPLGGRNALDRETLGEKPSVCPRTLTAEGVRVKSASSALEAEEETDGMGWDFTLYPNPAKDELFLRLPDDAPKEIVLHDLAGRQIHAWSSVVGPVLRLPLGHLATGVYAVRVFNGATSRTKKLIIH